MRDIEKNASGLLMSGLVGGLFHGAQNLALLKKMKNNTLHKEVLDTLKHRASGANSSFTDGLKNAMLPEIGALADHAAAEGNRIKKMSSRDRTIAIHMLKGNLSRVLGSKRIRKRAIKLLEENPRTKDYANIASRLANRGLLDDKETLMSLENLYKNEPLTRNISKLTNAIAGREAAAIAKAPTTPKKEAAGEIAGNVLLATVEPFASGLNVTKRFLADHDAGKSLGPKVYNFINKFREGSNSLFVKSPIKKSFIAGIGGKYKNGAAAKNQVLKASGNALLASAADFAGKVGHVAREEAARRGGNEAVTALNVASAAAEAAEKAKKRRMIEGLKRKIQKLYRRDIK